jgi:hypothetical protein
MISGDWPGRARIEYLFGVRQPSIGSQAILEQNFRNFIHIHCNDPRFLFAAQFFQVDFAFRSGTAVMTGFYVNQLFGLAAVKIFCSLPGCMLVEPSGDIVSDASVKRVVGAEDDVDEPIHGSIIQHKKTKNTLISKILTPAIRRNRHTGRDCRYLGYRDVVSICHPWLLDSGNPCRNDVVYIMLRIG